MAEHNLKVYLIHYLKKKQFKLYQPFSQGRANEGERILILHLRVIQPHVL